MAATVTLTDAQLEEVQRAMLRTAIRDLEHATAELQRLEVVSPWPEGAVSSDAQNAVELVRESVGILDAIGWPRDETRGEWEARMQTATGEGS